MFAVIHTDKGDLIVELFPEAAPKTVENFVKLSNDGFYDGIIFHRVIPQFMAQTGDPEGTGRADLATSSKTKSVQKPWDWMR